MGMGLRRYWTHLLRHCLIAGDNRFVTMLVKSRVASVSPARFANVLMGYTHIRVVISNWWGGGAESYVLNRSVMSDASEAFVLVSPTRTKGLLSVECLRGGVSAARCYVDGLSVLATLLPGRAEEIIINQLTLWNHYLGLPSMTSGGLQKIADEIIRLRMDLGCALTFMVHDYYSICPRITIVNERGSYCNAEYDCRHCADCLSSWENVAKDLYVRDVVIAEWRSAFARLLSSASEVRAFSLDSANRISRIFPDLRPTVVPHELSVSIRRADIVRSEAIRFGVFGSIGIDKGCRIVRELDGWLEERGNASDEILVFGRMDCRGLSRTKCIGCYRPVDMPELIEKFGVNVALFPSVWPETFSYVTQELMATGVPLICLDIGAQGERVSWYEKGEVLHGLEPAAIMAAARRLVPGLNLSH